ncbi:MAG: ATP-binding protein [Candidatus Nanoarchaeia archaeon]|nr:ATP-binding protein [Candidatus Nanoarchaeia archaeon]
MAYDIVIGRTKEEVEKYGTKGTVFVGKTYVKVGPYTSLSNNLHLDMSNPHVMMICGKRGSGKSYSASVIAEEMARLPQEIKKNLSVLFFDTLGVFWTMKKPNTRQQDLLLEWGLKPEGMEIDIYTPKGHFQNYKEAGIPTDYSFTIKTSELTPSDWSSVFGVKLNEPLGILIERAIGELMEKSDEFSIKDIINFIENDTKSKPEDKNAAINRFLAADKWGLFEAHGTPINELIKPGKVTVLDISAYTESSGSWSIKGLVIGLISRKLLIERISQRKKEELESMEKLGKMFLEQKDLESPMVWIMLDEAHEFLPKEGETPASSALVQLLREGRQPGISMVLVTQQPGEIHKDVLTQSDVILSHRLTAKADIDALNQMMQSYLLADINTYLNELPRLPGSAIILDDKAERIYPMRIHPKRSWHGGEAPSALREGKKPELKL